jgi:hypothetical protein
MDIAASAIKDKIKAEAKIIDVRTAGEFADSS